MGFDANAAGPDVADGDHHRPSRRLERRPAARALNRDRSADGLFAMVRRIIAWRAALARAARRKLPARGRERGIALLATMLATALMTILVVDFTTTSSLSYRAAANQ